MATFYMNAPKIIVGQNDLSLDAQVATMAISRATHDDTKYGDTARVAGLGRRTASFTVEGMTQLGSSAVDAKLRALRGVNAAIWYDIEGLNTSNNRLYFMNGYMSAYRPFGATVGDRAAYSAGFQPAGIVARGVVMEPFALLSASKASTSIQLGTAAVGDRLVGIVVITAATALTSLDVDFRSDDASGMATPTIQHSMTQITAVGDGEVSETAVGTAITDDWWDANITLVGTDVTIGVGFAILKGV